MLTPADGKQPALGRPGEEEHLQQPTPNRGVVASTRPKAGPTTDSPTRGCRQT